MRFKILFLILISLSLCGCPDNSTPKAPLTKVFTPIYKYTPEGCKPSAEAPECKIDWDKSYFYGVLRSEPDNPEHFERISIFNFLTGEGTKRKPRLLRGGDYNELGFYEQDLTAWGNDHCKGK